MPAFLLSCRFNPDVEWRIFTDTAPPPEVPDNVQFVPLSLGAFNQRASAVLGFEVKIMPDYVYKLCDLKIAYGEIFKEELEGFDFWGCCDIDLVWGDIRRFITPELLGMNDLITSRPVQIAGHFCLFRNMPEWNGLYRRIVGFQALVDSPQHVAIDEHNLSQLLQGYERSRFRRFWMRCVQGKPVPRVFWGPEWTPRGRYQRRLLQDPSLCLKWEMGRVFGTTGEELMYLHFHKMRSHMAQKSFDYGDSPEEFTISLDGISIISPPSARTSQAVQY
jgi:hypothetical protein